MITVVFCFNNVKSVKNQPVFLLEGILVFTSAINKILIHLMKVLNSCIL